MSQVDNRNSSATKRARTDGSRREDDWTCPSCGNVNFSFRTTCNMRNCTQPRPADHNSKSAAKPLQPPQNYSAVPPYVGSGAPSSMYMGVPPYGSSMFNGSSLPPYEPPYSGGSAYPYNYGSRISAGSPYRPLHISTPPPYSGGSMMGNGGMYGMPPPMMDRYGMGMPMAPAAMGPRPTFFPDDKTQKKDATRDNDWSCPKCGNINFSFRTVCNMRKCNTPKPGSQAAKSDKNSKQKMPEGSWKCEKCNNINYPFRTKCNRPNCGAEKPAESQKSPSPTAEENDQVCVVIYLVCIQIMLVSLISSVPFTNSMKICEKIVYFCSLFHSSHVHFFLFCCCLVAFIFPCTILQPLICDLSTVPVSTRDIIEKVHSCRPALLSYGCLKVRVLWSSSWCGCCHRRVTLPSHGVVCQVVVSVPMVSFSPLVRHVSVRLVWEYCYRLVGGFLLLGVLYFESIHLTYSGYVSMKLVY